MDQAVILACSSFRDYISSAQQKMGTHHPVVWLDEELHRDPKLMRQTVLNALDQLPETIETVLVSMGFCGGSWADIPARQRIVIPRADDCVSILLRTSERRGFNLKETGHLYVKGPDPKAASFKSIFQRMTVSVGFLYPGFPDYYRPCFLLRIVRLLIAITRRGGVGGFPHKRFTQFCSARE